jgi:hypothetical protein
MDWLLPGDALDVPRYLQEKCVLEEDVVTTRTCEPRGR